MTLRETILAAINRLSEKYPPDKITINLVAKEADVSQPAVHRYIGGKQQLKELLESENGIPEEALLDTRSRILLAARQVFAREGYAGATLDAIFERLDCDHVRVPVPVPLASSHIIGVAQKVR